MLGSFLFLRFKTLHFNATFLWSASDVFFLLVSFNHLVCAVGEDHRDGCERAHALSAARPPRRLLAVWRAGLGVGRATKATDPAGHPTAEGTGKGSVVVPEYDILTPFHRWRALFFAVLSHSPCALMR